MSVNEFEIQAPGHQTEFDASAVQFLLDRLGIEPDEACVISVVAVCQEAAAARLVFGSVLFGPPQMAAESWPQWSARTDSTIADLVARWEAAGVNLAQWSEFSEVRGGFLFGRWTLAAGQVAATGASWLLELLNGRVTTIPVSGSLPLIAVAHASKALIRVFPSLPSPAQPLVLDAERPVTGFLFPLEVIPGLPTPEANWNLPTARPLLNLPGYPMTAAPMWLLGLPISDPPLRDPAYGPEGAPVPGLFIGRLQRQAWLIELRTHQNADTFTVRLGIDESRIGLADLEIDQEEYADGDLVGARRIHLDDLTLPSSGPEVTLTLPTLGPGLSRQVRLFDRNGLLLDATDRFYMVERININVSIAGQAAPPTVAVVGGAHPVTLLDRLRRADRAAAAYRALLEAGLPGRVIDDPTRGLPELTARLSRARGHLDVLDPYFGRDLADWNVLGQALVPIRVLTGPSVRLLPTGTAPLAPSCNARSWRSGHPPPWHDRVYLWDGGGLTAGTSPSGLSNRVTRLDYLDAVEAAGWQTLFDTWWNAQNAVPIRSVMRASGLGTLPLD